MCQSITNENFKFFFRPVTNLKMSKAMSTRSWGVTQEQQLEKGSFVDAFECLVCRRISEEFYSKRKGFKHSLPYQANKSHYGCEVSIIFTGVAG